MSLFPLSFLFWALFLESPDGFADPESRSKFAMITFKINVLRNLKMIQWNYQSSKQNWLVCELRTLLLFNRFLFEYLILGPISYQNFWEANPRRQNPWPTAITISPDFIQNNLDSFTYLFLITRLFPCIFLFWCLCCRCCGFFFCHLFTFVTILFHHKNSSLIINLIHYMSKDNTKIAEQT